MTLSCIPSVSDKIVSVSTKTNENPGAKIDEQGHIYVDVCNNDGTNCCTTNDLDNKDKDDFELGELDLFTGILLGSCNNFEVNENSVYKVRQHCLSTKAKLVKIIEA